MDIKSKNIKELEQTAYDIRQRIIEVVSKNGGHFSSTLGAVELTLAMHKVFTSPEDPFIFDVSHQCYAHKLITNRWDDFASLRQFGGLSGFTKPNESPSDYFVAGHSSTSISLAIGAAKAIALKKEKRVPVVMIGDGSISAGIAYEALNELGDRKYPIVVILNDNEMSIARPIGAISKHLSKLLAGKMYQGLKERVDKILTNYFPDGVTYVAKKIEESMKLITPGIIFEEMGVDYIGPIDGHNLKEIIQTLEIAKNMNKPVIVHARTTKGKGYDIAQGHLEKWHGVGPFDIKTGKFLKKSSTPSATDIFSKKLTKLARKHENVVGITAAMPSGTGLDKLIEEFPNRFWDVAIAEQHAVASAASMAKEGLKPFVAIYSTFLQRAYDQIIHDVCIMNLGVVFCIDRAGLVGNDGETHQGVFDISFLRVLPNMLCFSPRDAKSLEFALDFAYEQKSPCALRYPRGAFEELDFVPSAFELGKSELLVKEKGTKLFISYGSEISRALKVKALYEKENTDKVSEKISILDLRFVKPLDEQMLKKLAKTYKNWYIFSASCAKGGVGSAILEFLSQEEIYDIKLKTFEYSDNFIEHGDTKEVEDSIGLNPKDLVKKI